MLSYKYIDGIMLRDMIIAGAALLEKSRESVDALNVFPVPDGDTGTNMSLTMQSAVRELSSADYARVDEAANAIAKGTLKGARGNSGVIVSQLFRGFAKALNGIDRMDVNQFAEALVKGSELAYKAVMKPKEGTILTVARVIAEEVSNLTRNHVDDFTQVFQVIMLCGDDILRKTTDMLPALKQAGVVDSGGSGLMYIYRGCASVLFGNEISLRDDTTVSEEDTCVSDISENLVYSYCLSFSIINPYRSKPVDEALSFLHGRLNLLGDRVSASFDGRKYNIHIRTTEINKVFEYASEIGEFDNVNLINLSELKRQRFGDWRSDPYLSTPANTLNKKNFGIVAVSSGEGFMQCFKDLSVDEIVEGGQTMNPSVDDLLTAIKRTPAETVFILPNNGNVIFAANQASEMSNKSVIVIPTKNTPMGIAAALALEQDLSAEENKMRMNEAAQSVDTAMITYAVRDSEYNGVKIKRGDIVGLYNGEIAGSGVSIPDIAIRIMKTYVKPESTNLISVYYGSDVTESDARKLTEQIAELYPECDVECHNGGQPLYYYLISVE